MTEMGSDTTTASCSKDPVWERALDWLMRVQAAPDDQALRSQRDAWVAADEAHAKAHRKAEKVWRLSGHVPPSHPVSDPPITATATARIAVLQWQARSGKSVALAALAACMALLLLPNLSHRLKADYRTGTGETRQVALADGSTVALDAESAIAVSLSGDRRAITLLDGHAYFQVTADHSRPFVVNAGEVTVTVTGTAFEVRSNDQDVTVEVASGTVSVAAMRAGTPENAVLTAGRRARVARADGALTVDSVPPQQVALWRNGRLVVNGATVAQVVEELRHHYRGLILLRDQELANRQVTGVFDLNTPVAALDAVLQPHNARAHEWAPHVLVISVR